MFLITGCPRSGTSHTHAVLNRSGLKVGSEGDSLLDALDGLVSWMHLPSSECADRVAIQVRNPVKVIQSMQTMTLNSWTWMVENIRRLGGSKFVDGNLIHRGSWGWYHWIKIAMRRTDLLYRIEDSVRMYEILSSLSGVVTFNTDVPKNDNTRANQYRVFDRGEMEQLGGEWFLRCMELAQELGYTEAELYG